MNHKLTLNVLTSVSHFLSHFWNGLTLDKTFFFFFEFLTSCIGLIICVLSISWNGFMARESLVLRIKFKAHAFSSKD